MEEALRYELVRSIPELKGEIYPTNAPESSQRPYLVYKRLRTDRLKVLSGYTSKQALNFMFSAMAARYEDMKVLSAQVEALLLSLPGNRVGNGGAIRVEDLTINNIEETYEHNLKLNRGIIDFTIYF